MGDEGGFVRVNGLREGDFNTHFEYILYVQLPVFAEGLDEDNLKREIRVPGWHGQLSD